MTDKDLTAHDIMEKISANCNNILAFLQVVAVKFPRFMAAPF